MLNEPNSLLCPIGYICPICKAELYDRYRPFCGECGQQMPPEIKLQAIGSTIYPHRYGLPIRTVDEITSNLNAMGPASYWLEEYHPTFRTTKIRIRNTVKHQPEHELVCTSAIRIELPIENGWVGIVAVKQHADELYELSDNANKVLVVAGSVSLHTVARA